MSILSFGRWTSWWTLQAIPCSSPICCTEVGGGGKKIFTRSCKTSVWTPVPIAEPHNIPHTPVSSTHIPASLGMWAMHTSGVYLGRASCHPVVCELGDAAASSHLRRADAHCDSPDLDLVSIHLLSVQMKSGVLLVSLVRPGPALQLTRANWTISIAFSATQTLDQQNRGRGDLNLIKYRINKDKKLHTE